MTIAICAYSNSCVPISISALHNEITHLDGHAKQCPGWYATMRRAQLLGRVSIIFYSNYIPIHVEELDLALQSEVFG